MQVKDQINQWRDVRKPKRGGSGQIFELLYFQNCMEFAADFFCVFILPIDEQTVWIWAKSEGVTWQLFWKVVVLAWNDPCLFLLITKVFRKFKRILFGKNIRWCTFNVEGCLSMYTWIASYQNCDLLKSFISCRNWFFFSKFLMGTQNFSSPSGREPTGTKSDGGGGDLWKNLTKAETAHLMQN